MLAQCIADAQGQAASGEQPPGRPQPSITHARRRALAKPLDGRPELNAEHFQLQLALSVAFLSIRLAGGEPQ